jgi:hypothetical protein
MVTVRIGEETRAFSDVTENWVNEQIQRRRHAGQPVCVEVRIKTSGLDLRLTTPGCGGGGGGGRLPNANEHDVLDLWEKRGLTDGRFTGGNLVAFLKQLQRKLG